MTFRVTFSTDNEAFGELALGPEIAHILRKIAKQVESGRLEPDGETDPQYIHDSNGNKVGQWTHGI
jgi:hypothetical protein